MSKPQTTQEALGELGDAFQEFFRQVAIALKLEAICRFLIRGTNGRHE